MASSGPVTAANRGLWAALGDFLPVHGPSQQTPVPGDEEAEKPGFKARLCHPLHMASLWASVTALPLFHGVLLGLAHTQQVPMVNIGQGQDRRRNYRQEPRVTFWAGSQACEAFAQIPFPFPTQGHGSEHFSRP